MPLQSIKRIYILVFIFFVAFSLCTCHKYPEDEKINFKTVMKRLDGLWHLTQINYNGDNYTNAYNDTVKPNFITDVTFIFKYDYENSEREKENRLIISLNNYGRLNDCLFSFDSNKKALIFENDIYSPSNVFVNLLGLNSDENTFTILKLYKNDLHIKNSIYELYFSK